MFNSISKLMSSRQLRLLQNICIREIATKKRFYRRCNVVESNGVFEVTLDHRKLKTPKGNLFSVDSEPLAIAVATEWDAQKEKIVQSKMHLTGLCWTAIDNPDRLTTEYIAAELVNYLESDTIFFPSDEDGELYTLQSKEWIPVTEWFCKKYDVAIAPSRDISGPQVTDVDKNKIRKHFLSHNLWSLIGFRFAIEALKSVTLGLACFDSFLTAEQAVRLSRLEEEFQSRRWGRVEWAHDLSEQDSQARVAAGIIFAHCNSSSYLKRKKVTC